MNKKLVAILVGVVAVAAIIIISLYGIGIDNITNNFRILKLELNDGSYDAKRNSNNIDDYVVYLEEEQTTYQIGLTFTPTFARDKSVDYTSSDELIATVSTTGLVTFLQEQPVSVTIATRDGSSIVIMVSFYFPAENTSQLDAQLSGETLTLETSSGATTLSGYTSEQLVLFGGVEYTFNLATDLGVEFSGETENVLSALSVDEQTMTLRTFSEEEYQLRFFVGESQKIINVKVVPYLFNYTFGDQYNTYRQKLVNIATNNDYLDKTVKPYAVGNGNAFAFDIKLESNTLETLSLSDVELTYSAIDDATSLAVADLSTIVTIENNQLTFTESSLGNTYTFTVVPTHNFLNRTPLTFKIKVNNGVNVWTHSELREAFGDLNNENVNIHSNITAVLSTAQINSDDNTAKNFDDVVNTDGSFTNTGSVYIRGLGTSYEGKNELAVYGNYFNINGENLPLANWADRTDGQFGSLPWTGGAAAGQLISSVHVGIFATQDRREYGSAANQINQDNYLSVTYNDLKVIANSSKSAIFTIEDITDEGGVDLSDEEELRRLAAQGSAYIGIKAVKSWLNTNNTSSIKSIIAYWTAQGNINLNKATAYDIWSLGMYSWGGSTVTLTGTKFSELGGPILLHEDITYTNASSPIEDDLIITLNEENVFDNPLTGSEGWFVTNGYTGAIPGLKTTVQDTLALIGKSMIRDVEVDEQTYEMFDMNFIIVGTDRLNQNIDAGKPETVDAQYTFNRFIGFNAETEEREYNTTQRRTGYLAGHPLTTNGSLLSAIGSYATLETFKELQHTIAMVNGYLTNDAQLMSIYNNAMLESVVTPLTTKINAIFQTLTTMPFSPAVYSGIGAALQQQVLLAISDQCVQEVKTLLDTLATLDPTTVAFIRGSAEADASAAQGAFAISFVLDDYENRDHLLEIISKLPVGDQGELNLVILVEYSDVV